MSKSLGNVVDPIELMDEYGADSLRFALTSLITHGQDITLTMDKLVGARNFSNKLWNAARFVLMNLEGYDPSAPMAESSLADRWIVSRHRACVAAVNAEIERRNLAQAADLAYEHVWGEFCDWYVELAKIRLYGEDAPQKARAQATLATLLESILKLLHPIMPFITEELWQTHTDGARGALAAQPYPTATEGASDPEAEGALQVLIDAVTAIRSLKADLGLASGQKVEVTLLAPDSAREMLAAHTGALRLLAGVSQANLVVPEGARPEKAASTVAGGVEVYLHLGGPETGSAEELARLEKQIAKLDEECTRSRQKLGNAGFTAKAPADVIEKERQKLAEAEEAAVKLRARYELLKGAG
jgi:valyl-tRNA synthetase